MPITSGRSSRRLPAKRRRFTVSCESISLPEIRCGQNGVTGLTVFGRIAAHRGYAWRAVERAAKSGHEDLELFSRLLAAAARQRLEHGLSHSLRELQLYAGGRQARLHKVPASWPCRSGSGCVRTSNPFRADTVRIRSPNTVSRPPRKYPLAVFYAVLAMKNHHDFSVAQHGHEHRLVEPGGRDVEVGIPQRFQLDFVVAGVGFEPTTFGL